MKVDCTADASYTFEIKLTHDELVNLDRDSDNLLRLHQGQQAPMIDALLSLILAAAHLRGGRPDVPLTDEAAPKRWTP